MDSELDIEEENENPLASVHQVVTHDIIAQSISNLRPSFVWKYCWSEDDDFYLQRLYVNWDNGGVNFYSIEYVSNNTN